MMGDPRDFGPMAPSTVEDFNRSFAKFHEAIGNKRHTHEQIRGGLKGLTLKYLGLQNVTDEELETCATFLQIAIKEAQARGWAV